MEKNDHSRDATQAVQRRQTVFVVGGDHAAHFTGWICQQTLNAGQLDRFQLEGIVASEMIFGVRRRFFLQVLLPLLRQTGEFWWLALEKSSHTLRA